MRTRRNSFDISVDILKIVADGAKKSLIVYGANLNFQIVKKYLNHLYNAGLLTPSSVNERVFKTIAKGREYLLHYETLNNYLKVK